jgi:hypothetical protein
MRGFVCDFCLIGYKPEHSWEELTGARDSGSSAGPAEGFTVGSQIRSVFITVQRKMVQMFSLLRETIA